MYEPPRCGICGLLRGEHDDREALGTTNHEFNEAGDLIPKDRAKAQRPQTQSFPRVIGVYDLELRKILLDKGIISNEDFAALLNPGTRASRDRETGEAPSSE